MSKYGTQNLARPEADGTAKADAKISSSLSG